MAFRCRILLSILHNVYYALSSLPAVPLRSTSIGFLFMDMFSILETLSGNIVPDKHGNPAKNADRIPSGKSGTILTRSGEIET